MTGRKRKVSKVLTGLQRESLASLYLTGATTPKELALQFGIALTTVYKTLWREGVATGPNSKKRIEMGLSVDGVAIKTTTPRLGPGFKAAKLRKDFTQSPKTYKAWSALYPYQEGTKSRAAKPAAKPFIRDGCIDIDYMDEPWSLNIARLAELTGIRKDTITKRFLAGGWEINEILTPKAHSLRSRRFYVARGKGITFKGETLGLPEWAERTGILRVTLRERLKSDWSVEKTLTTPTRRRSRADSTQVSPKVRTKLQQFVLVVGKVKASEILGMDRRALVRVLEDGQVKCRPRTIKNFNVLLEWLGD